MLVPAAFFVYNIIDFSEALVSESKKRGKTMLEKKYDWENPAVIKRNKEDGHVIAFSYDSAKKAVARETPDSKMTLNGDWKFHWQRGLKGEPTDFYYPHFDDSAWRTIRVPSVWQTEKTGSVPYYYASTFPRAISRTKSKIPTIDHDMQEIGHYRRVFTLLRNRGAEGCLYVYLYRLHLFLLSAGS